MLAVYLSVSVVFLQQWATKAWRQCIPLFIPLNYAGYLTGLEEWLWESVCLILPYKCCLQPGIVSTFFTNFQSFVKVSMLSKVHVVIIYIDYNSLI